MTPEDILKKHYNSIWDSDNECYVERIDKEAIEAIKQYAREMCDKQRDACIEAYMSSDSKYQAIRNTEYPKELQ